MSKDAFPVPITVSSLVLTLLCSHWTTDSSGHLIVPLGLAPPLPSEYSEGSSLDQNPPPPTRPLSTSQQDPPDCLLKGSIYTENETTAVPEIGHLGQVHTGPQFHIPCLGGLTGTLEGFP